MIRETIKRYKNQLGDSIWSIMGLVLMNLVAQVLMYPLLARIFGEAGYGDIQYLMAYINIITVSVGCAANYARMTSPAEERMSNNGDYNLFLLVISLLGLPFTVLVRYFGGVSMDLATTIAYYLLFVSMAFRYYADISYKLTLRYRRYFLYYLFIGVGYGIGAVLVWFTHIWPLAIVCGEVAGILYAYLADDTLRKNGLKPSPAIGRVLKVVLLLCVSEGVTNLIANVDRLLIKFFIGASAVAVWYLATLVGKTVSLVTTPLNGVLIGYLARYEGKLTKKMMSLITVVSLVCFAVLTAACVLGGFLVLILLYPDSLENVKPYLWVGSFSQVIFFVTNFVSVVLIRFAHKRYQIYINVAYAAVFFGLGIPMIRMGLWQFAWAVVVANAVKWLVAILLGFYWAARDRDEMKTEAI